MGGAVGLGQIEQARALLRRDAFQRGVNRGGQRAAPCPHFDKDDLVAILGDDVQFAERAVPPVARVDRPACALKVGGGDSFSGVSK